eukprot:107421-Chlamydomonas_euryale.AAC.4
MDSTASASRMDHGGSARSYLTSTTANCSPQGAERGEFQNDLLFKALVATQARDTRNCSSSRLHFFKRHDMCFGVFLTL